MRMGEGGMWGMRGTATKQMLKKISTLISLLFYGNETRRERERETDWETEGGTGHSAGRGSSDAV